MDMRTIRDKSSEELANELRSLGREAFRLRMQKGTGQMPRPSEFRRVRRDVARIRTVLRERMIAEGDRSGGGAGSVRAGGAQEGT